MRIVSRNLRYSPRTYAGTRLTHSPICDERQTIRATGNHTKCSQVRQAKYAQGSKA